MGGAVKRVAVEYVRDLALARKMLNDIPFDELEITENGVVIEIDREMKETWKFMGLDNYYFILEEYYKGDIK